MKTIKFILLVVLLLTCVHAFAQNITPATINKSVCVRQLTIEPAIGIHTNFGTDLLLTNLIQWNPRKRISLVAHSSFNINNITQRYFNGIKTNYNYSINQKFGAGTTLYGRKWSHTFLLMIGVRYTTFRETLDNDQFDQVSTTISSFSPDYGSMYSLKRGWKKWFFTCRMYVPLYPWPVKGANILYLDGNLDNISLEFGVGIRII